MSKVMKTTTSQYSDTSLSTMGYRTHCTINHIDNIDTDIAGNIYNQRTTAGTVPAGSPINMVNIHTLGTGVSYDAGTATININRNGVYLFIWNVLSNITTNDVGTTDNIIISLENALSTSLALSGNISTGTTPVLVTGSYVDYLTIGTRLSLINRSGLPINLVPSTDTTTGATTSFTASLSVVKIS